MPGGSLEDSYLHGLRVLELGGELGEFCGKVLAGLGADVVRVEPPQGAQTRTYGPFYQDVAHPDCSLYFWHYNHGKRSLCLDMNEAEGQRAFEDLAKVADVVLDSRLATDLTDPPVEYDRLSTINPRLIYSRITPFGDSGPWSGFVGSDLVHLALGGVMMNCGYDPDPHGHYDTPPVAPAMWQAYHIAGELAAMSILGALSYRLRTGVGQALSTSVHEAVSKNTETDLPDWIFLRQKHRRLTCRHSMVSVTGSALAPTKDGRYLLPYRTYLKGGLDVWDGTVKLLKKYGMQADLEEPIYQTDHRDSIDAIDHMSHQTDKLVGRLLYQHDLWWEAQELGLPWSSVRRPDENIDDDHWWQRGALAKVAHPELGRDFTYVGARWRSDQVPWRVGHRAPRVGEHSDEVFKEWTAAQSWAVRHVSRRPPAEDRVSKHGKPFALSDTRVVDLSWMLASAGGARFLAAMGAEVIKVEHSSRWDGMRFGLGQAPTGGRAERDSATDEIPTPEFTGDPNRSGSFMEINAGKLGISLNLKNASGRRVLEDLIREADVVVEGFSAGTMTRMGLSYDRLRELNPSIIYVQQSGFGEVGRYGRARAFGPTTQALTGLSDMSGLPSPYPPAGIGYSYLDWFGAYNVATAILAALYNRDITGKGCHIDASQAEVGLYLTGTAVLDSSANGRPWQRFGNRSPYKLAAPHGAYRVAGDDRWVAISVFTEEQWNGLVEVLEASSWVDDDRFNTMTQRIKHQEVLDALITANVADRDPYVLMNELQARGIPAGVCQTAQDRCENDPQLAHLEWLVELPQSDLGTWPVKEHPTRFSETPTYIGGRIERSGPSYGEDTDRVLRGVLHLNEADIDDLRSSGAL